MILFGYAYYNRKVGAYTDPRFETTTKENKIEAMQRAYVLTHDANTRRDLSESDLVFVGTFDDKSGEFELVGKPEFLCNFGGLENGEN